MNRNLCRRAVLAVAALAALGAVACQPAPIPTVPRTYPAQAASSVWIEGDSVTFQTAYGGGDLSWARGNWVIGATAAECPHAIFIGCRPATQTLPEAVAAGQAETVVWALGFNDVWNGWTPAERLVWIDLLEQQVPASSCLVLVTLGGHDDIGSRDMGEVAAVNDYMRELAARRPNTVLADGWQGIVDANPSLLSPDEVHLASLQDNDAALNLAYAGGATPAPATVLRAAADARADLYRQAVAACP